MDKITLFMGFSGFNDVETKLKPGADSGRRFVKAALERYGRSFFI
jgi:hypothetical protein